MNKKKKLSNIEIASFCNQTALLFQAGITPADSIRILYNDAKSPEGKALLKEILDVCKKGEPFHSALSATECFPDYVIHMVSLGQESGNLDVCMLSLAAYYEKEDQISDNIRSAISYPLIMIMMMLTVIFVLISKVMPIFEQVFNELGSEMTGFAASLLNLGDSLNRYSMFILLILCVLLLIYMLCTKTATGRRFITGFLQTFPLTKGFYHSLACGRFARSMAICFGSGMDVFSSLDITYPLVENTLMQQKIKNCKSLFKKGSSFPEALMKSNIFSNLYSQMIAAGFKSGNVEAVFKKIAEDHERNTDKKMQSIISVLEPTLVIILSIVVGLILLSVILPLMGIMASIG